MQRDCSPRDADTEAPARVAPEGPPVRLAPAVTGSEKPDDYIDGNDGASDETRCLLLSGVTEGPCGQSSSSSSKKASVAEAHDAFQELLTEIESKDRLLVEQNSIYGTALVMPQYARSTGWSANLTILAARSYLFLGLNVFVQWMLLYSLMKEQNVMDKFSGQMYLCNFGAEKMGCPDGPGCLGPGGTRFTPSRTYSYEQWNIQKFVKNSLKVVFPESEADIDNKIDPGEYGVESHTTRLVCTWLFVLLLVDDAQQIFTLLKLLWRVPSAHDSWMARVDGEVVLRIMGMPFHWKIINLFVIVLPKVVLWKFTIDCGMLFLMETPSMQDLIVNSTALSFILSIDELLFATITTAKTRFMLENLQAFVAHLKVEHSPTFCARICSNVQDILPLRLMLVTFLWMACLWQYYINHCIKSEDGTWYSKPMYLPLGVQYSHLSAFLPSWFPNPSEAHAYWVLPSSKHGG